MKNYILITVILVLVGCTSVEKNATSLPVPAPVTQLVITPTVRPEPYASTPTVVVTPTLISFSPTLDLKQRSDLTLKLLQTNNSCELPCWWGIIPNETNWRDADLFLKTFSHIFLSESPDWAVYFVRSPVSKQYSELGEIKSTYATQDGVVKEIEISEFDENTFHLSSFLQKYGIPAKILVSTYSSGFGRPDIPLSIDLYYPDKGINVLYGTYAIVDEGQIKGCLKSPHIFLWSPKEYSRSLDYILGWDKDHTPYKTVEEATDLNIKSFYEKYKDPQNAPCLQTSISLWPGQ